MQIKMDARGEKDLISGPVNGRTARVSVLAVFLLSFSPMDFLSVAALSAVLIKSILQINNKQKCSAP